jgi:S1-C subfamily serine protease
MKGWKTGAVVTAVVTAAGLGASMAPVAHGQSTVTPRRAFEIFSGGSRIGVSIRDLDESDAKSVKEDATGVVIEEVSTDSPAAKAGLRKGDVIVEFDRERVRSARQLTRLVQETPAGRAVPATVLRDGQRTSVTITPDDGNRFSYDRFGDLENLGNLRFRVAPKPPSPPAPPAPPMAWDFDELLGRSNRLGVTVDALTGQLAEYFGAKQGVLVTSVYDNSAAAKAGLKAGDVITSFDGSPVEGPADMRRRIQGLRDGDEFTIEVLRDRKGVTLKGKAERTERRRTSRTIL